MPRTPRSRAALPISIALAAAAASAMPAPDAGAAVYTVKELKPFAGGTYSSGRGLNAAGSAVGAATDKQPSPWGARWDTPGAAPNVALGLGNEDYFNAINGSTDMVGQDLVYTLTYPESRALLATGGQLYTLSTSLTPFPFAVAYSISDKFHDPKAINYNSIAGAVSKALGADPNQRAAAWTGNGSVMLLDTLPGGDDVGMWNVANSISNIGLVGGTSSMKGSPLEHAVIWGVDTPTIVRWLTDPQRVNAGLGGGVQDVRDNVYFAGYYYPTTTALPYIKHACYWDGSMVTTDLGTLYGGNSTALATRNHDFTANHRPEFVGWSDKNTEAYGHIPTAFVWDPVHKMRDLNALIASGTGWDLQIASDIGNDGRIVGTGALAGQTRGFVLMPIKIFKVPPFLPSVVAGGQSAQASIEMSEAVPDDVTIALSSSSAIASVPATVTVPRGRSSVGFSIATRPVRAPVDVVITATFDDEPTTGTLRVTP